MEIDLLALALRHQHAGFPQNLEVVGDRGAGERGNLGDLPHIEPLARLEGEEDALPVFVT
jgi:hypothetical protein